MSVRKRGNKWVIDFACYLPDNRKARCVESEGPATEKNLKRVKSKWKAIQYALKVGNFDYLTFFPHGSKSKYFRAKPTGWTFDEWWNIWMSEKSVRQGTKSNYQYQYENHIKPHFGHMDLRAIGYHEVAIFRTILVNKGLKDSTVNTYMKPLCMALLAASDRGHADSYACKGLKKLVEQRPNIDPFSFDELKYWLVFLEKKNPEWHDLVKFWMHTGLRPGELIALRWEHIDLYNGKAMIRENYQYSGEIGPPKTEHSIRNVDLAPEVKEALKRQRGRTGLIDSNIWLDSHQKRYVHSTLRDRFKFFLKLAGLKHRPPKQMRHTFATLHIAAGENISWVSKMLGHSSVEITLKKYNRFIPNLTRNDGSAFQKIMESEVSKRNNRVTGQFSGKN